jgi:putative phage-type endonuclease
MTITAEQRAERKTGIGGSDCAAALGLSRRKTSLELYLEKRGEIEVEELDAEYVRLGNLVEPAVRQIYAERTGRTVHLPAQTLRHPKYPFMLANVDGLTNDGRVYEGKAAHFSDGYGEPGTDQVPQEHYAQTQHYMIVTGAEVADLAVLIGLSVRIYEIPADRELQQMIIEVETDLWGRIQSGRRPDPDFEHSTTPQLIRRIYPGTDGSRMSASEDQTRWRAIYEDATARATRYQDVANGAKAHLLDEMGGAAILAFPDGMCLRRQETKRAGYAVDAATYIDTRFIKDPERKRKTA